MQVKNNLLAKDLKFYSWSLTISEALSALLPFPMQGVRSLVFSFLLEDKGILGDVWSQHFTFFLNLEFLIFDLRHEPNWVKDFVVKDGVLPLEITEPRSSTWIDVKTGEEEIHYFDYPLQNPGLFYLMPPLDCFLTWWFALPSLINDLYKYSLENDQSTKIEEILLKAWLELPLVIDELYSYLRHFAPAAINFSNDGYYHQLPYLGSSFKLSYGSLTCSSVNDKEEDLTPFTREFLKVADKIPFHLKEYLNFFKLSLKNKKYSEDFDYFFKLLTTSVEDNLLMNIKISNEGWKLLMYNCPFPLKVFLEMQQINEKLFLKDWGEPMLELLEEKLKDKDNKDNKDWEPLLEVLQKKLRGTDKKD